MVVNPGIRKEVTEHTADWLQLIHGHDTNNLLANPKLAMGEKDLELQGYHPCAGTYPGNLGESCIFFRIYFICN